MHNKLREKTDGGLLIAPRVNLVDPKDIEGYRPPKRPLHEEDEFDPGHNPLENFRDGFLNHPYSISFDFFDPEESLGPPTPNWKLRSHKGVPTDTLISIGNLDDEGDQGDANTPKRSPFTKTTGSFGLNPPAPGTTTYDAISEREFTGEEVDALFTDLGRKAADNIESKKVKREDITQFIIRDNGTYQGDELTRLTPHGLLSIRQSKFRQQQDTLPKQVIDNLLKMQGDPEKENEGHTFGYAAYLINHGMGDNSASGKEIAAASLTSAILHGIGDKEFLPTFLDSLKKIDGSLVDDFLGKNTAHGNKLGGRVQRALPINSPYHGQLIRNRYNKIC